MKKKKYILHEELSDKPELNLYLSIFLHIENLAKTIK
jgi:hypothetical protein